MESLLLLLERFCLIPVIGGSIYAFLCLLAALHFRKRPHTSYQHSFSEWPPVTILKPIFGLEKNIKENLRSACVQDYPEYQVVFSVQNPQDPAVSFLKEIQKEFGSERVFIAIENIPAGQNRKINNLLGALPHARYDILIISDSDVRLNPNYLKTIVPPLLDSEVGCACTLYRAVCGDRWFEKLELLTLNADFIPSVIFAYVTGASKFCLGSSFALTRKSLEKIGGLEAFAHYLPEDYEIGRRVWASGQRVSLVHYFVDIVIDLKSFSDWWHHQCYWDQMTRAARPVGFFATFVTRSVPFALFFAALRFGDTLGWVVLGIALGIRLATALAIMEWGTGGRGGIRSIAFLPLRDVIAFMSWFLAFVKKTVIWRGKEFTLTRKGLIATREERS
jgi:ceramide glucosyltransferase